MEYKHIEIILKENIKIRELLTEGYIQLALDILTDQFDWIYTLTTIKNQELTLSEIEQLDDI